MNEISIWALQVVVFVVDCLMDLFPIVQSNKHKFFIGHQQDLVQAMLDDLNRVVRKFEHYDVFSFDFKCSLEVDDSSCIDERLALQVTVQVGPDELLSILDVLVVDY